MNMKYHTLNKFKFEKDCFVADLVRVAYLVIGKGIV
jgi:hypothetical protein